MSCAMGCVRWLLFIFNFVFCLGGLALLICGVFIHIKFKDIATEIEPNVILPTVGVIVIGCVIFVIAFFGCCGAIKESHCMVITFGIFLLTILVVQIALAIFAFLELKDVKTEDVREEYEKLFNNYWTQEEQRQVIDVIQSGLTCCGVDGPSDFDATSHYKNMNGTHPESCCDSKNRSAGMCTGTIYEEGCLKAAAEFIDYAGRLLGGIAIGIAGVELIGIIFAFCLANSIRNSDRRAFRV